MGSWKLPGNFRHSAFENTGNDCIDFSGSEVFIEDIVIHNSGDKGVSAGERSTLTLRNIKIYGALTGIAAKDGSFVDAENIELYDAEVGLAVFRKKPEYDVSKLQLTGGKCSGVLTPGLIERGSEAFVNNQHFAGYQNHPPAPILLRLGSRFYNYCK